MHQQQQSTTAIDLCSNSSNSDEQPQGGELELKEDLQQAVWDVIVIVIVVVIVVVVVVVVVIL